MAQDTSIPDPLQPKPSIPNGGLERMIQLWEGARDANPGGYGGGVIHNVEGWGSNVGTTTSCSPFTACIVAAMFDASGNVDAGKAGSTYSPLYDGNTTPLPFTYYEMHNVFYFSDGASPKGAPEAARRKAAFAKVRPGERWSDADTPVGATLLFNLGYEIDPQDVRRGDLIAIDWASGHGHAAFVWDVHTNATGEVDCLQYLSANGYKGNDGAYHGVGVSVAAYKGGSFMTRIDGAWTKNFPLFVDNDLYITDGAWYCLPGVSKDDVRYATFRVRPTDANVSDKRNGGLSFARLRAARFWGFAPPETPHGSVLTPEIAQTATDLCQWQMTPPYANATE